MANTRAPWADPQPQFPSLTPCTESGAGGLAFPRFISAQDSLGAVEFSPKALGEKVPTRDLGFPAAGDPKGQLCGVFPEISVLVS